jgi:sugar phosphate isomerase/epimerase
MTKNVWKIGIYSYEGNSEWYFLKDTTPEEFKKDAAWAFAQAVKRKSDDGKLYYFPESWNEDSLKMKPEDTNELHASWNDDKAIEIMIELGYELIEDEATFGLDESDNLLTGYWGFEDMNESGKGKDLKMVQEILETYGLNIKNWYDEHPEELAKHIKWYKEYKEKILQKRRW